MTGEYHYSKLTLILWKQECGVFQVILNNEVNREWDGLSIQSSKIMYAIYKI